MKRERRGGVSTRVLALSALAAVWIAAAATGCAPCQPGQQYVGGRCVVECVAGMGFYCELDGAVTDVPLDGTPRRETGPAEAGDASDGGDGASEAGDGATCAAGQTRCGATCATLESDPMHCGMCGRACPAPSMVGMRAVCAMGTCGTACEAGFELTMGGTACEVRVPRPITPTSTGYVTSRTPRFRWELPAGVTGATVELCPDRAFMATACQTIVAEGTTAMPMTALTPGAWFWRLRGRVGSTVGRRTGPIWVFHVGAGMTSTTNTSWLDALDANGDGLHDVVVGGAAGRIDVFLGAAASTPTVATTTITSRLGTITTIAAVGDVDGDGFGDLLCDDGTTSAIFWGDATGRFSAPALELRAVGRTNGAVAAAGDLDLDGFGDVVIGDPAAAAGAGAVYVRFGSTDRLDDSLARVDPPTGVSSGRFGAALAGGGDADGDGAAEVMIGAPTQDRSTGAVHIIRGAAGRRAFVAASAIVSLGAEGDEFGGALAGARDVNGDGLADLAVAAPGAGGGRGRVNVYLATATGYSAAPTASLSNTMSKSRFGEPLTLLGDTDSDGRSELLVGQRGTASVTTMRIYRGSADGIETSGPATYPGVGEAVRDYGTSAGRIGDFDGDLRADLVVTGAGGTGGQAWFYMAASGRLPARATSNVLVVGTTVPH